MNDFFTRLESVLDERDISMTELANKIGTAVSTTYMWKSGAIPQRRTTSDICSALGIKRDWLLEGKGERDDVPQVEYTERANTNRGTYTQDMIHEIADGGEIADMRKKIEVTQGLLHTAFGNMNDLQHALKALEFKQSFQDQTKKGPKKVKYKGTGED